MKRTIMALALTASLYAEESRVWTHEDTGRTLEGQAIDKKRDGSSIQIEESSGRKLWLKTESLTSEDQTYAKHWCADHDKLEARVIKSSSGGKKTIKVVVNAGNIPVKEVCESYSGESKPTTKTVPARTTLAFEDDVTSKYVVTLYSESDGTRIDQETSRSKTGL